MDELISKFSVERISKAGAKFDFEKAKWYNQEWIKRTENAVLMPQVKAILSKNNVDLGIFSDTFITSILDLVKERLTYIEDFWEQASFFFQKPAQYDVDAVKPKWNADKTAFFQAVSNEFAGQSTWDAASLEPLFKGKIAESGMKIGELNDAFPHYVGRWKVRSDAFKIAELLGKKKCWNASPWHCLNLTRKQSTKRIQMNLIKKLFLGCAASAMLLGTACSTASKAPQTVNQTNYPEEKLGWKLGAQAYTFRLFTFAEALDKIDAAGLRFVEAFPGQKIGAGSEEKMTYELSKEGRELVKKLLKDKKITLHAYGVVGAKSAEEWDKVFAFAKDMGVKVINCEPEENMLDVVSTLADKYDMLVGIHNHPTPSRYWNPDVVLEALKGAANAWAQRPTWDIGCALD